MTTPQIDPTTAQHQPSDDISELDATQSDAAVPNRLTVSASPTDIICGRGFHIVNHRGNLNLHLMVNAYREEYMISRRSEKRKITNHVLDEIKSTGARFIRRVSDGKGTDEWQEVDEETAYNKVGHALRLRTKNESNRENGPTAAASAVHRKAGDSTDESDQQKPRRSMLPKASDSSVINDGDSKSSRSRKKNSPSLSTGIAVSSIGSIPESETRTSSSALLRSQNEPPAGQLNVATGLAAFVSSPAREQRLQHEINQQAYWNIMCAFLQQSQR